LHGNSLYEPLIHVPLIVVWPNRIPAGMRVPTPVSLAGLPNTVLELLGSPAAFPGDSWVHCWDPNSPRQPTGIIAASIASQASHPPCHGHSPVAHGPMQCVRDGDLKYIRGGQGLEELYDLARDPAESENLALASSNAPLLNRMRTLWAQRHLDRNPSTTAKINVEAAE
jgi:arylsulfatase A-like enzyme